jgi:hypothetical protein
MSVVRLTRPNITWAIAYENAFEDASAPTAAELNERRFVHLMSCAFTEDGTELTKDGSETDDTITFCSIGNEQTLTLANFSSTLTWLKDANTGGSGSTVDLTSLFNKAEALLGAPDQKFWIIKRVGPDSSQDDNFAIGHIIQMVRFDTDYPVLLAERNAPLRGQQNLVYAGDYNWNYEVAS